MPEISAVLCVICGHLEAAHAPNSPPGSPRLDMSCGIVAPWVASTQLCPVRCKRFVPPGVGEVTMRTEAAQLGASSVSTYTERAYGLWVKRLADADAEVERWEARLSRVLGRLRSARKRARTYRRKLAAAEEGVALGEAEVRHG